MAKDSNGFFSQIFKIIFKTRDIINIFANGGIMSVMYFQVKSRFSGTRSTHGGILRSTFVEKVLKRAKF